VDGRLYLDFDQHVKHHYSRYAFEHVARLDLPTFMDPSVSQQLDAVSLRYGFCSVGRTLDSILHSGCSILMLIAQVGVLVTILREQGFNSSLSLSTCLCHLAVCILELANSGLDGCCRFFPLLEQSNFLTSPNSVRSHDSKPGLRGDGGP
jgi:hypothetical protein